MHNSFSYNSKLSFLKLNKCFIVWRWACAFDINLMLVLLLCLHFELSHFLSSNTIKVYSYQIHYVRNLSYSSRSIVWKPYNCFCLDLKTSMCFWYNSLSIFITKTCLFKYTEILPTKIVKFSDKIFDFFIFLLKNIDCWYSLEPPRCFCILYLICETSQCDTYNQKHCDKTNKGPNCDLKQNTRKP